MLKVNSKKVICSWLLCNCGRMNSFAYAKKAFHTQGMTIERSNCVSDLHPCIFLFHFLPPPVPFLTSLASWLRGQPAFHPQLCHSNPRLLSPLVPMGCSTPFPPSEMGLTKQGLGILALLSAWVILATRLPSLNFLSCNKVGSHTHSL